MRARGPARLLAGLIGLVAVLLFVLTSCPSYRDGMSGQLFSAKDDTLSAARSAALAIELWSRHQSTEDLTCVQLSDARDEVVKAYEDIATLKAQNPTDLARQALLTRTTSEVGDLLNDASAAVRAVPGQPDPRTLGQRLTASADALERDYR
jgi:hypothetical protein